jgi:hypothetical protein
MVKLTNGIMVIKKQMSAGHCRRQEKKTTLEFFFLNVQTELMLSNYLQCRI